MTQTLYDHMAIPEKCLLNKPLYKKLFQEHADLDITDKKVLKDDVDKIRWIYTLKPSTLNIKPYRDDVREYDEIAIIQIDLTSSTRTHRIVTFVNKAIPYPIVLIFRYADTIAVSVADKRINQADITKWVVEDAWMTAWFNPDAPNDSQKTFLQDIAMKNLSFIDFYAFYTDIKSRVIALNAADKNGTYKLSSGDETLHRVEALRQLDTLEQEKTELQNKLAKEIQMGRQVEMTTKIKIIADQISGLKKKL